MFTLSQAETSLRSGPIRAFHVSLQSSRFDPYLVWICVGCCEAVDVREGDVSGDLEVLPEEKLDAGLENVAAEFRLLLHLEGFSIGIIGSGKLGILVRVERHIQLASNENCTNSY